VEESNAAFTETLAKFEAAKNETRVDRLIRIYERKAEESKKLAADALLGGGLDGRVKTFVLSTVVR
jgi:hypothetical protein